MNKKKLLAFVASLLCPLAASLAIAPQPKLALMMVFILTPAFSAGLLMLGLIAIIILATLSSETGLVNILPA